MRLWNLVTYAAWATNYYLKRFSTFDGEQLLGVNSGETVFAWTESRSGSGSFLNLAF
jgi:hypothetical protein